LRTLDLVHGVVSGHPEAGDLASILGLGWTVYGRTLDEKHILALLIAFCTCLYRVAILRGYGQQRRPETCSALLCEEPIVEPNHPYCATHRCMHVSCLHTRVVGPRSPYCTQHTPAPPPATRPWYAPATLVEKGFFSRLFPGKRRVSNERKGAYERYRLLRKIR
jgi:hypothetical protein